MKKIIFCLLLVPIFSYSQDYVELFKFGYGETFNNDFENTSPSTHLEFLEADISLPLVLNEKNVFVTGGSFSYNRIQLFPNVEYTNLYSTSLKVGLATTFNSKWSTTIVLLPKIASDYNTISGDDFYMGGYGVLKLQKRENLIYRFGLYATSEAFGFYATPILGWYYLSPDKKFEMDVSLPIAVDVNYNMGSTTVGIDYFGIGRSYNINQENQPKTYVDQSSLEFSGYFQWNTFQNSILLRAKAGYSTSNNDVYADGDNIDFGLAAFNFGDDRVQLNPDISGGIFLKFEAIFRLQISSKKKDPSEM